MKGNESIDIIDKSKDSLFNTTINNTSSDNNNNNNDPFSYLIPKQNSQAFKINNQTNNDELKQLKSKYSLLISITIPSNTLTDSRDLQFTLNSICNNVPSLKELSIEPSRILLCLFIQHINTNSDNKSIFSLYGDNSNTIDLFNLIENEEYLINHIQVPKTSTVSFPLNGLIIIKNIYMTEIEIKKFFFAQICANVINDTHHLYTCCFKAGIIFTERSIKDLILSTYERNETIEDCTNICSVPAIETISSGLFSQIQQYQCVHNNIYDLHYYNMTSFIPVNSCFTLFKLSNKVLNNFISFYLTHINLDASIYYHDNKFALYLKHLDYSINYMPYIEGKYIQSYISFIDLMYNYSLKYQGHLLGNYDLIKREVITCRVSKLITKLLLLFHVIGLFVEITFPSFTLMVIYPICYEAFRLSNANPNPAIFASSLYIMLILVICFISITIPNPYKNTQLFFIIYIITITYLYIVLALSILAMHFINVNSENDVYTFNTAALVTLIVFNVLFGVAPMILNFKKISTNILEMIYYLILGCPAYNSVFMLHAMCNVAEGFGSTNIITKYYDLSLANNEEYYRKKGLFMIGFVVLNCLMGMFVLLLDNRSERVNCVLTLGIIFTVYNFVKMGTIVWSRVFVVGKAQKDLYNYVKEEAIREKIKVKEDVNVNVNAEVEDDKKEENGVCKGDCSKVGGNNSSSNDVESHNKQFLENMDNNVSRSKKKKKKKEHNHNHNHNHGHNKSKAKSNISSNSSSNVNKSENKRKTNGNEINNDVGIE